jgi:hypothetical protein
MQAFAAEVKAKAAPARVSSAPRPLHPAVDGSDHQIDQKGLVAARQPPAENHKKPPEQQHARQHRRDEILAGRKA